MRHSTLFLLLLFLVLEIWCGLCTVGTSPWAGDSCMWLVAPHGTACLGPRETKFQLSKSLGSLACCCPKPLLWLMSWGPEAVRGGSRGWTGVSGHVAICLPGVVRTGTRFGEKASSRLPPAHLPWEAHPDRPRKCDEGQHGWWPSQAPLGLLTWAPDLEGHIHNLYPAPAGSLKRPPSGDTEGSLHPRRLVGCLVGLELEFLLQELVRALVTGRKLPMSAGLGRRLSEMSAGASWSSSGPAGLLSQRLRTI